jgi:hypothetical protein
VAGRVGARVLVRGRRVVRDGGAAAVRLEGARHPDPGVADEYVQLRAAVGVGGGAVALAAVAPVCGRDNFIVDLYSRTTRSRRWWIGKKN